MCCLVLRSNLALLLTIQFALLISSLINIIRLLLTTFDWTKVRGIAPRSHTGRPRTCLVNHMGKYDHRQHVLSDWLAELEQRFQLGEVNTDKAKITWCQLLIGATGGSILAGLEDDATWEAAKETLLSRVGAGSVRDEAWASLKQLKRGSKEIIELAGEAEKLAKRLHPHDVEAAERHAIDAFLDALDRPLAAEVQKLGCRTMEEVVAAARRIERILE